MTEDQRQAAQERLAIIKRAHEFETLLENPGWKVIYARDVEQIENLTSRLRDVETSNTAKAIDTLQRWQIASELLERRAEFINSTLEHADKAKHGATFEDAYLMERLEHEQSQPPELRTAADSAGY